jgi:hypothetical protein
MSSAIGSGAAVVVGAKVVVGAAVVGAGVVGAGVVGTVGSMNFQSWFAVGMSSHVLVTTRGSQYAVL